MTTPLWPQTTGWYEQYKERQREYQRQRYAQLTANPSLSGGYRGPMVGCCGEWHIVERVPFTTPCCGRVLFEDLP